MVDHRTPLHCPPRPTTTTTTTGHQPVTTPCAINQWYVIKTRHAHGPGLAGFRGQLCFGHLVSGSAWTGTLSDFATARGILPAQHGTAQPSTPAAASCGTSPGTPARQDQRPRYCCPSRPPPDSWQRGLSERRPTSLPLKEKRAAGRPVFSDLSSHSKALPQHSPRPPTYATTAPPSSRRPSGLYPPSPGSSRAGRVPIQNNGCTRYILPSPCARHQPWTPPPPGRLFTSKRHPRKPSTIIDSSCHGDSPPPLPPQRATNRPTTCVKHTATWSHYALETTRRARGLAWPGLAWSGPHQVW